MAENNRSFTLSVVILLLIVATVYCAMVLLKPSDSPLWLDLLTTLIGVGIIALSANRLFAHFWIRRPITLRIGLMVLTNIVIYGLVSIDAPIWIYILIMAAIIIYACLSPRLRYWPNDPPNKGIAAKP